MPACDITAATVRTTFGYGSGRISAASRWPPAQVEWLRRAAAPQSARCAPRACSRGTRRVRTSGRGSWPGRRRSPGRARWRRRCRKSGCRSGCPQRAGEAGRLAVEAALHRVAGREDHVGPPVVGAGAGVGGHPPAELGVDDDHGLLSPLGGRRRRGRRHRRVELVAAPAWVWPGRCGCRTPELHAVHLARRAGEEEVGHHATAGSRARSAEAVPHPPLAIASEWPAGRRSGVGAAVVRCSGSAFAVLVRIGPRPGPPRGGRRSSPGGARERGISPRRGPTRRLVAAMLGRCAGEHDRPGRDSSACTFCPASAGGTVGPMATARSGSAPVPSSQRPSQPDARRISRDRRLPDVHRLEVAVVGIGEADALDDGQLLLRSRACGSPAWRGAGRSRRPSGSTVEGSMARLPRAARRRGSGRGRRC